MYGSKGSDKNAFILVIVLLAGIIIGGFIGELTMKIPYMGWLSYGQSFGFTEPFRLDLGIIMLQFAITIRFTVGGVLGLIVAYILFRRM